MIQKCNHKMRKFSQKTTAYQTVIWSFYSF